MSTATIEDFRSLPGAKSDGNGGVMFCCPCHKDRTPSGHAWVDDAGAIAVCCLAGCEHKTLVAELEHHGLYVSNGRPSSDADNPGDYKGQPIVEFYDYFTVDGAYAYTVGRTPKNSAGEKQFPTWRRKTGGGYLWKRGDVPPVIYQAPKVAAAVKTGAIIFVAEGEKDVHTLERLGLVATTNSNGVAGWRSEFGEQFKGARLVVKLNDNDDEGRKHGDKVAVSLERAGVPHVVVDLPDLPNKGDVSDWVAAGGTVEQIFEIVGQARDGLTTKPASERETPVPVYSGIDLAAMKIVEPEPLIEGMAYVACSTLFMGKLKGGGKTTASLDMCRQRITGEAWCGRQVRRGPVLYLTEQSPQSFNPQCARAGLLGLGDFHVIYHRDVSVAGLDWPAVGGLVHQASATIGADLIFIDNFSLWVGFVGDDESSSGPGNESMAVVERLLAAGLSVVAIQHTRKEGGSIYDAARGSTAIAGRFDELAWIKGSPFPKRRSIQCVGRVFAEDPPDVVIELDDDHRYQLVGNAPDLQDEDAEGVILEFLPLGREGAKTEDEVIGACKAANVGRDAASRTLRRLCDEDNPDRPVERGRSVIPSYKGYGYWRRHDLFAKDES